MEVLRPFAKLVDKINASTDTTGNGDRDEFHWACPTWGALRAAAALLLELTTKEAPR